MKKFTSLILQTPDDRMAFSKRIRENGDLMELLAYNDRDSTIKEKEMDDEFLPEIAPIIACLGDELSRSSYRGDFYQPLAIHHLHLSVYTALRAIEYLNANPTKYRSMSGHASSYIDENGKRPTGKQAEDTNAGWRISWLKTLFRCVLCMPLGYMVAHTVMRSEKSGSPAWQPNMMDLPEYIRRFGPPRVTKTDFWLGPRELSFDTYRRLYNPIDRTVPMLAACEAEFFNDRPNQDNPLSVSYRRALNHVTAKRDEWTYPYWWSFAINHERILDGEFVPIRTNITCREGFSFSGAAERNDSSDEDHTEKLSEPSNDLAETSTPEFDPILQSAIDHCRQQFDRGEFIGNGAGAVFQGISGNVHVVVPLFWKKLVDGLRKPGLSSNGLHKLFLDAGFLEAKALNTPEDLFEIKKQGARRRLGKCRTLRLSDKGIKVLFPAGVPFGDNPDLVPLVLKQSASAA